SQPTGRMSRPAEVSLSVMSFACSLLHRRARLASHALDRRRGSHSTRRSAMKSRFLLLTALLILGSVPPAAAQYMRILTDNPLDNTRMRSSGTTILTITLDTDHDRNGSLQACNSHSAASCGIPSTTQP